MIERSKDKLQAAMQLLQSRNAEGVENDLTWNRVCELAGVPRSTASRAKELINDWKKVQRSIKGQREYGFDRVVDGRETYSQDEKVLRETIEIMGSHIQALSILISRRDRQIALLLSAKRENVHPIR